MGIKIKLIFGNGITLFADNETLNAVFFFFNGTKYNSTTNNHRIKYTEWQEVKLERISF